MTTPYNPKYEKILNILMHEHIITDSQLKEALKIQKQQPEGKRKKIGEILMDLNYTTYDSIMFALSLQLGYNKATEEQMGHAKKEVVALIPEPFAKEKNVLAFEQVENKLKVAMYDPDDIEIIDNLQKQTNLQIEPYVALKSQLEKAIERHYQELKRSGEVDELFSGLEFITEEEGEEQIDISKLESQVNFAPIVKLVNLIIMEAIKARATDIHIEPSEDRLYVRYRIDGVLQEVMSPPKQSMMGIISRIKVLSKLNLAERRLPQDGRMTVKLPDREVDVRVSVLPTVLGEKIVLRLLDKGAFELNLLKLGFDKDKLQDRMV